MCYTYLVVVFLLLLYQEQWKKKYFFCSMVIFIQSIMFYNKDRSSRLWKTLSRRSMSLGSKYLNSPFNLIAFSQFLHLENLIIILLLDLLIQWNDSIFSSVILTTICSGSSSLWLTEASIHEISTHSAPGNGAFFYTSCSPDNIYVHKILNIFNNGNIRLTSSLKFLFSSLISLASEFIVFLVFCWLFRNKSISYGLFSAFSVSSLYTLAITSTKMLQWDKKLANYLFTFNRIKPPVKGTLELYQFEVQLKITHDDFINYKLMLQLITNWIKLFLEEKRTYKSSRK